MKSLFAILICVGFSQFSYAEGPCKTDIDKFCAGMEPGGGAIAKCLKEHQSELSAECKAKGQELKEHMHQMKDACEADVAKFCGDVKKGKGRILKCLKKHEAELSPECKSSRDAMKAHKKESKNQ